MGINLNFTPFRLFGASPPIKLRRGRAIWAASFRDDDLPPAMLMLNSIALSDTAIQAFSDTIKMHYYGSKWIADGNKKIIRIGALRIKMFYFLVCYIICISSCTSARQTTPVCRFRLSTALYGKLHVLSVKKIRADDGWRPQVSNVAGIRKAANIAAKKDYTGGEFLSNSHTDKFHQNRTPLESIL